MRLLHLRLRQLRLHRQLELQFHPRFTLVGGANEAGKSTLVEALHKGLFLKATATGKGVEELRSRQHSGLPEVEIGFEAQGRSWLLRKRFAGSSGTVQLADGVGTSLNGAAAEERLAELLGVEAAVEGRRISQLPQRWAHLWVRQGEAGANPLAGGGNSYDLDRLLNQLQQRGSSAALESPLDRQVEANLQLELSQLFTATGKVKAGSVLAQAQGQQQQAAERLQLAQERLAQLETAMEELAQIEQRLELIDGRERPALEAQQQRWQQQQRQLEQAKAQLELRRSQRQPLAQQWQALRQLLEERQQLEGQRQRASAEQGQLLEGQRAHGAQLQAIDQQLDRLQGQLRNGVQASQQLQQRLELGQLLLDQAAVEREAQQLQQHRQQFNLLQQQAAALKTELSSLPPITAERLQELRQAERRLGEARARSEAMAATVTLLRADQPVLLDGKPLLSGSETRLVQASRLQVGPGVELEISPGGGEALANASAERLQAESQLAGILQAMHLANLDAAEAIAQQRQRLESELANLRRNAAAIPWQRLDEQLAALQNRRQQLNSKLENSSSELRALQQDGQLPLNPANPANPDAAPDAEPLEVWLQEQRQQLRLLQERQQNEQKTYERLLGEQQHLQQLGKQTAIKLGELAGLLSAVEQRLQTSESEAIQSEAGQFEISQTKDGQTNPGEAKKPAAELSKAKPGEAKAGVAENSGGQPEADRLHGQLQQLQRQLAALDEQLLAQEQQLAALQAETDQGSPTGGGEEALLAALRQLLAEKEELLLRRGQNLQLCRSLGATNPQADCEQCQAALDHCQEHNQALMGRALALRSLVERFGSARSALADRYGEPMARAIASYLELLGTGSKAVRLNFDGSSGFNDLQLQQAQESYAFERLSGGMREQLAAALRLAMAEVLAPAYDGSLPLVFDDAFTNSDPERIQGLHQMLERACQSGVQVLLLSCTPNAYADLADRIGSRLELQAPLGS
jgi:DNA repair exonuclease SbcCD ATPase subunit